MALVSVTGDGELYSFGVGDADAPEISNFVPKELELKFENEVYAVARDPRGVIQAIVASKPTRKKILATITGFYKDAEDPSSLPSSFSFNGRFFILNSVSKPSKQAEFNQVVIIAESIASVTALAA